MNISFHKVVPLLTLLLAGIVTAAHASDNKAASSESKPTQLAQVQVNAPRSSCPTDSSDRKAGDGADRAKTDEQSQFEIFLKQLSRESGA